MCKGISPHHGSNIDTSQFFTFYYYFYLIETNRNWTVFYRAKKKIPIGSKIWGDSLLEFVFLMAQRHQGKLRWISKSDSETNTQLCGPTQGRCVRLPDRPLRDFLLPHPNCSSVWIDTKKASAESLSDGYTEKPSSTHHSTHSRVWLTGPWQAQNSHQRLSTELRLHRAAKRTIREDRGVRWRRLNWANFSKRTHI